MGLNHTREIFTSSLTWRTPTHKLVALVMAYSADRRGIVRLTQQEVAGEVGVSRQRIAAVIDDLCELQVLVRLGHGRYGLRFGLPKDGSAPMPNPKGADEEFERLAALRQQHQAIAYNADGWPVLMDK